MSNNPTSASAIIGDPLELGRHRGGTLVRELLMPAVLVAFATYLLVGILTMRVPEGTVFPGPQFFPGIITIGLYLVAVLLVAGAVKEWRAPVPLPAHPAAAAPDDPDDATSAASTHVRMDWVSFVWITGGFLVFALTLGILGWVIGAALLYWCVAWGFGARRALFNLFCGFVISSLTYIVFDMLLGLTLPSGLLGWGF